MKILDIIQGSKEWEDLRRVKVTATDIATLMTGSEREIYDRWEQKIMGEKKFVTKAMQHGLDTEAEARSWLNGEEGMLFLPLCALHDSHDWLMVSLDGWDWEDKVTAEIKCPSSPVYKPEDFSGYKKAWWQIQTHHAVVNPSRAIFLSYYVSEGSVERPEVSAQADIPRDEGAIAQLLERGAWFYDHLMNMTPPYPLESVLTERNDEEWKEAAHAWIVARNALKEAEEIEAICREGLIFLAKDQSSKGGGISLSRYVRRGAVDYAKIPELKSVDLEKFRKPNSVSWRINGP